MALCWGLRCVGVVREIHRGTVSPYMVLNEAHDGAVVVR